MTAAARPGPGWVAWAAFLAGLALVLGLAQVWFNMGRTDLAYELGRQQAMLEQKLSLADKLEMERDSLLASHRLRARAEAMHLSPADTGRLRVMEAVPAPDAGGQGS